MSKNYKKKNKIEDVNIDDENDKVEKQSLEEFIQTHHTPFSKTIIKNDD